MKNIAGALYSPVLHPWSSAGKESAAMQETWVQFLGQENFLEKEVVPTPVCLPRESHGQRSLADYSPWGHKSWTRLSN